jgi:hypothetical protein
LLERLFDQPSNIGIILAGILAFPFSTAIPGLRCPPGFHDRGIALVYNSRRSLKDNGKIRWNGVLCNTQFKGVIQGAIIVDGELARGLAIQIIG